MSFLHKYRATANIVEYKNHIFFTTEEFGGHF